MQINPGGLKREGGDGRLCAVGIRARRVWSRGWTVAQLEFSRDAVWHAGIAQATSDEKPGGYRALDAFLDCVGRLETGEGFTLFIEVVAINYI